MQARAKPGGMCETRLLLFFASDLYNRQPGLDQIFDDVLPCMLLIVSIRLATSDFLRLALQQPKRCSRTHAYRSSVLSRLVFTPLHKF